MNSLILFDCQVLCRHLFTFPFQLEYDPESSCDESWKIIGYDFSFIFGFSCNFILCYGYLNLGHSTIPIFFFGYDTHLIGTIKYDISIIIYV